MITIEYTKTNNYKVTITPKGDIRLKVNDRTPKENVLNWQLRCTAIAKNLKTPVTLRGKATSVAANFTLVTDSKTPKYRVQGDVVFKYNKDNK